MVCWPELLRDHLVQRGGEARALGRGIRAHAGKPGCRIERVHRTHGGAVLDVLEGGDVFLEGIQRRDGLPELEVRALAGGGPDVDFLAIDRVVHDGAVRQVEEPRAGLRCGRGLRQRRACRHHGVEERQSQCHAAAAQERAPGQVLLGQENRHRCLPYGCVVAATAAVALDATVCVFFGSLPPERIAVHDAVDERAERVVARGGAAARSAGPAACRSTPPRD